MKTAVLISGQTRTFAECFASQRWHVYRKLENPTFFVSVTDDEQARDIYLLESMGFPVYVEKVIQPQLEEPHPINARHAPYVLSVPIQAVLRQLWHLNRVWEFHAEKAQEFDYFVRVRPDSFFHSFATPAEAAPNASLLACLPWWGRFGGCNDRFAMLGQDAAEIYFTTFGRIAELLDAGCPLHPESFIAASLEARGAWVRNILQANFSTVKRERSGSLVYRTPEILPHEQSEFLAAMR